MNWRYTVFLFCTLFFGLSLFGQIKIVPKGGGVVYPCAVTGQEVTFVLQEAASKCTWVIPTQWKMPISPVYSGVNEDTVKIFFPQNCSRDTLKVTLGSIEYKLGINVISKANPIIKIYGDSVYCEGKEQKVWANFDARVDSTNPNYYYSSLKYKWEFLDASGTPISGYTFYKGLDNSNDSTLIVYTPAALAGGRIRVTPSTCDRDVLFTSPTVFNIKHFVKKDAFKPDTNIQLLKYVQVQTMPTPIFNWQIDNTLKACTYYSGAFNTKVENRADYPQNHLYGAGDGYVYFQAGKYSPTDIMEYTWEYDSYYLELDMSKMSALASDGFGINKSRILFKVKDVALNAQMGFFGVKATAKCWYCEDTTNAVYHYGYKFPELTVEKEDSLMPYKNYQLQDIDKNFCSEADEIFTIKDLQSPSITDKNGTEFYWQTPTGWVDLGATTSIAGLYTRKFKIGAITSFSDSVNLTVHPQNKCFKNGRDSNRLITKVYIKNKPLMPVFYDERGIPSGLITPINRPNPPTGYVPGTYLLCNGNSSYPGETGTLVNTKDSIIGYEVSTRPNFFAVGDDITLSVVSGDPSKYEIFFKVLPSNNYAGRVGEFGVKMINACGLGSEGKFQIAITDTLAVLNPIVDVSSKLEDYDTLPCEGSLFKPYISNEIYTNTSHPNYKITDVCIPTWKIPETWKFAASSDTHKINPILEVGSKAGFLEVSFKNKCGSSKAKKSLYKIDPLEYTRITLQGQKNPCQGAQEVYKFDTVADTQVYIWKFPNDWVCPNGQNIDTTYFADPSFEYTSMNVIAGKDSGYLQVRGFNYKCDTCTPPFLNPRIDSLKLNPKTFTKAPMPTEIWEDTICARTSLSLFVKAAKVDSGNHMNYTWLYNSDWVLTFSTPDKDSMKFTVPDKAVHKDTISIISHRSDCPLNEGDTLRHIFVIMDTVATKGAFLDGYRGGIVLDTTPCEGDTVFCYLNPTLMDPSVKNMVWKWAGSNSIHGDDSLLIDNSGWRLVDTTKYRDTLALIVGRNSLTISVQAMNCCGVSLALTHDFSPVNLVVDTAKFDNILDFERVCNLEDLEFTNSDVEHSIFFEWHYPWDAKTDTTPKNTSRIFNNKALDTGYVYFVPYNRCGFGPASEKIHIKEVLNPPKRMVPLNFGVAPYRDTVMDTLCLRSPKRFELTHSPNDSLPLTVNWSIKTINNDILSVVTNQDTLCDITKLESATNFVIVAAKHNKCITFGDSLYIELRSLDTVSVPAGKIIENYIFNEGGYIFSSKPCGMDTMKFSFDWRIGQSIDSSWFQWNGGNEIGPGDSSMAGTDWKILDSSLLSQFPSKMYIQAGNLDVLNVGIKTYNQCGYSRLPLIEIEPTSQITQLIKFKNPLSLKVCDNEDLILAVDSVNNAGYYVWHLPLGIIDTVMVSPKRIFSGHYQRDSIWVVPHNGCGAGFSSDTLVFDTILTPPSVLENINFGHSSGNNTVQDTLCLRKEFSMEVKPALSDSFPLHYNWGLLSNPTDILLLVNADGKIATIKDTSNLGPVALFVAARQSYCKTYGDSLLINLISIDTVALSLGQNIRDYIYDELTMLLIDTTPCAFSSVRYYIDKNIHSTLDSAKFIWDGGQIINPNSTMGKGDWTNLGSPLSFDSLWMKVGNDSSLNLSVNVWNRCGISQLPASKITPIQAITQKAGLTIISPNAWTNNWCSLDTVILKVDTIAQATAYVWHYPWTSQTDTTTSTTHTIAAVYDSGYVWVEPINPCGIGLYSDSIRIEQVLQPTFVLPVNFALGQNSILSGEVMDTICLYGETELKVMHSDTNIHQDIIYNWEKISGGLTMTPSDASIFVKNPASLSDENLFHVAAKWKICKNYGDTLKVKLRITDTVATNLLGEIIPILPDTNNLSPCPGATMVFSMEHLNAAPAYKWTLPPTWTFVSGKDTTRDTVYVKVGFDAGNIRLAPITDASMKKCPYYSNSPIVGVTMTPKSAPLVNGWKIMEDRPCVGKTMTYNLKTSPGAKGFVWTFPKGWKANGTDTNVVIVRDSSCSVVIGKDSGYIQVEAWDSCDNGLMVGPPMSTPVYTIDTARVFVTGDLSICKDSTSVHFIEKNAYTDYFTFELIQAAGGTITYQFNVDSTVLKVKWTDTAACLVFKPKNNKCGMFINDTICIIADTIPIIRGNIEGRDFVCAGSIHQYTAKTVNLDENEAVKYLWELPLGWTALSPLDSSIIWVQVDDTQLGGTTDTLKCYPTALCGTALPFTYPVKVNTPDSLYGKILVENLSSGAMGDTTPCFGSNLKFTLTENYDNDTIIFAWSLPTSIDHSWILQSNDSSEIANVIVGHQQGWVKVQASKKGGCGWTKSVDLNITPSHIPPTTYFKIQAYPCIDDTDITYDLRANTYIDSVLWDFSSINEDFYKPQVSQFLFKYDRVHFDSVGSVPFEVKITSYNKCGTKDTSLWIIPSTNISQITQAIEQSKICKSDTAFCFVEIPADHISKGAMYQWMFPNGWQFLKDSLLEDQKKEMAWFVAGDSNGTVALRAYNGCGNVDTVFEALEIFSFEVNAFANPTHVKFRDMGVELDIQTVSQLTKDDYIYEWYPSHRVIKNNDIPESISWLTSTLVNPIETFWVSATERVGSPQCIAWDTVHINVDSTFSLEAHTKEIICNTDMVYLFAQGKGGDTLTYRYQWYTKENGEYIALEEPNFSAQHPVILSPQAEMSFMVVAYDSIHVIEMDTTFNVIQVDTQYLRVSAMDLVVLVERPYSKQVSVPIADIVTFEAAVSQGTGEYEYYWTPSEIMSNPDTNQLSNQTFEIFGNYQVVFSAKDVVSGCMKSDTVQLILSDEFGQVPNAFSPYTIDGINDVYMKGVDLIIMNRLGVELFKSKNKEGWNGTYKGKLVSKDDYFYVITIVSKQGKTYVKRGVVTVF